MPRIPYRYILGDSGLEARRLRFQARLWDPTAHALFDRIGVRRGWRVLELGPGQGSLHLELRRRVKGPIDGIERSPIFSRRLRSISARDGFGPGRLWECDILDAELPRAGYDLIFARWVFLFLPDPAAHLRKLVRALRPGGLLALEDYHRETMAMVPRPEEWSDFARADLAFFAKPGGDASIAGRLPGLFRAAGLEVLEITPTVKIGRPGSATWKWLSDYFLGVLDRYGSIRPLTPAKARRLRKHWLEVSLSPSAFMIAPTVVDIVGRKR